MLINNLLDQIKCLKYGFRIKGTIITLIIENSKCNNDYFQNKNNSNSNTTSVFAIKTRHKSISRGNSKITRKEMSKLFSCNYLTICRNVARWDAREESNQQKDDGFWLLWGIFNEYIKQNIFMAVLRKANSHSVVICRLIK